MAATLTGSKIKVSLVPPRPFINKCYPLLEPHILQLYEISERGTTLPTTADEAAAKYNIHADLQKQHQEHLDAAAVVYSASKNHSVAYRGNLTKLFVELGDGLKEFFDNIVDNLLTKLLTFNPLSPLSALIDGLNQVLSTLILKAGHIIDILNETTKSVDYGHEHHSNVHATPAGNLVNSADSHNDLKTIGAVAPAAITTILTLQGGLAFILANLTTLQSIDIFTIISQFSVDLQPTGSILTNWRALQTSTTQQQANLRDILNKIRQTAAAA